MHKPARAPPERLTQRFNLSRLRSGDILSPSILQVFHNEICRDNLSVVVPLLVFVYEDLATITVPSTPSESELSTKDLCLVKWCIHCMTVILVRFDDEHSEADYATAVLHTFSHKTTLFPWLRMLENCYLCDYPVDDMPLPELTTALCCVLNVIHHIGPWGNEYTLRFCLDTWYSVSTSSQKIVIRQNLMILLERVTKQFWKKHDPPPSAWATDIGKLPLTCATLASVKRHLSLISTCPTCADPTPFLYEALDAAVLRSINLLQDPSIATMIDTVEFCKITMGALDVVAERRRRISELPKAFKCDHDDGDGNLHSPSGPRGVFEVYLLEHLWVLLVKFLMDVPGTKPLFTCLKLGILRLYLQSGYHAPPESERAPVWCDWPSETPETHRTALVNLLPSYLMFPRAWKAIEWSIMKTVISGVTPFPPEDPDIPSVWDRIRKRVSHAHDVYAVVHEKKRIFDRCMFRQCPRGRVS
ncbi:hypothetical protein HGRIS_008782 [Hohenbuehelia grisea]|uniref:Uncharacterized protein n=1 Tax=Hohenbuehelia grisea TaxID=104357 RepID=A0ABR3J937_9AGAR